ncbi:MAG TPA: hypothetical protein PKJ16_18925, partial [Spirochaetota bacterium]|nr:hypothetical protein [Spirochaetota bacterium]
VVFGLKAVALQKRDEVGAVDEDCRTHFGFLLSGMRNYSDTVIFLHSHGIVKLNMFHHRAGREIWMQHGVK